MKEQFVYNDGGRAGFGSITDAHDCACRSIAIASGEPYEKVYKELTETGGSTPREGTAKGVSRDYLETRGWVKHDLQSPAPVTLAHFPKGRFVVALRRHLTAVIDGVLHDTYDCRKDGELLVESYWFHPDDAREAGALSEIDGKPESPGLDEKTTDRVKDRIRKLLAVAENGSATEGEIRNAMRFAQNLMCKHSLEREDLGSDENDTSRIQFARQSVSLNGLRRTLWEIDLAMFISGHLCPSCEMYTSKKTKESNGSYRRAAAVVFYGPSDDVEFCVSMFTEMIASIAATAKLKGYGGFARGSGAAYCQGFVSGVKEAFHREQSEVRKTPEGREMIELSAKRSLAVSRAAKEWLAESEGVRLYQAGGLRGGSGSAGAYQQGRKDGSKSPVSRNQKRIG